MIYVVIGTRAQLVKMAPIIKRLEVLGWPIALVYTGQHKESMDDLCRDFQLTTRWHSLYHHSQEVKTIHHAVFWLARMGLNILIKPASLLPNYKTKLAEDVIVIHGDTLSTLLGALIGKRLAIKVAHVEAGLRSFNLFNPFPEEIIRRLTTFLSDIAFCPGSWAVNNLSAHKHLVKINTHCNTIADSLGLALEKNHLRNAGEDADKDYGVVSLHRFENIFFTDTFKQIIEQLIWVAQYYPLIFVLHPATRKRLLTTGLISKLQNHPNIALRERSGYVDFVGLLSGSQFVITDGGSNQEELSLLGIPAFLMRKTTERQEGLNHNVCLGELSFDKLKQFINERRNSPRHSKDATFEQTYSPSILITDALAFASRD